LMESICPHCQNPSYYRVRLVIIPFLNDTAFYTHRFTCELCGAWWLHTVKASYTEPRRQATICLS
jgi:C4-type Zn-finger protein